MRTFIKTNYTGSEYITPGKEYEVKKDGRCLHSGGLVDFDRGTEQYVSFNNSAHIGFGAWEVIHRD